jgi:hypothetical protein
MLIRLMTTRGMAMLTFTPLMGWTEVVESFYPDKRAEAVPHAMLRQPHLPLCESKPAAGLKTPVILAISIDASALSHRRQLAGRSHMVARRDANPRKPEQSASRSGAPFACTVCIGVRLFVIDATATTFASTVAGGGANKVPVYSDGVTGRSVDAASSRILTSPQSRFGGSFLHG